jgi:predicted DNA-binding transcriptional regulator YafY
MHDTDTHDTDNHDTVRAGDVARAVVVVGGPSALRIAEYLAGWGSLIDVIEPTEVRMHLARIGAELASQYADAAAQDHT